MWLMKGSVDKEELPVDPLLLLDLSVGLLGQTSCFHVRDPSKLFLLSNCVYELSIYHMDPFMV